MRRRLIVLGCCAAIAGLAAAPAPGSDGASAPVTAQPAAHPEQGAPKNTKRCRKLIRKMNRAERQRKYRRLNRLANRYNRTCRQR
jgi:hypothetical protein